MVISSYPGPTCRVNIDDCADEPCKNGATCLDNTNDYTCQCADEWMGINCTQVCIVSTALHIDGRKSNPVMCI